MHQGINCCDLGMTRMTVTLEADTELQLRKRMRERGVTFKQAVDEAIIVGLTASEALAPSLKVGGAWVLWER
jgi:hypothetical protein